MSLNRARRHRARVAHLLISSAALVEEGDVPRACAIDPLALALEPLAVEGEDLLADSLVVRLEVGDDLELPWVVKGRAVDVRIDRARRRTPQRLEVAVKPATGAPPSRCGRRGDRGSTTAPPARATVHTTGACPTPSRAPRAVSGLGLPTPARRLHHHALPRPRRARRTAPRVPDRPQRLAPARWCGPRRRR